MNNKNKLGVLLCILGLMTALPAYAQDPQLGPMGITNDGLEFPDGSVQTTAATAPGTITEYRIIGITTDSTNGIATATDGNNLVVSGIAALNQMCVNDFGPAVRAAFSDEQLAPFIEPSTITVSAWVRPTDVRMVNDPDVTSDLDWYVFDAPTGIYSDRVTDPLSAFGRIDCYQFVFDGSDYFGLIRRTSGTIFRSFCNSTRPVACSARVQIPVYQPTQ